MPSNAPDAASREIADKAELEIPKRSKAWLRAVRAHAGKSVAVFLLLAAASFALVVALSGADAAHVERGVWACDVALGGLDEAHVRSSLQSLQERMGQAPLVIHLNGRAVRFEPRTAGFAIDIDATTSAVLAAARSRGFASKARALLGSKDFVQLVVTFDEDQLSDLEAAWESVLVLDHPVDGGVVFDGQKPVAQMPKAGHRVKRAELEQAVIDSLSRSSASPIDLPIEETVPAFTDADVTDALAKVQSLTSQPITLVREPTPEEIDDADRAEALRDKKVAETQALVPKWKLAQKPKKKKKKGDVDAVAPKLPPPVERPTAIEVTLSPADLVAATRVTKEGDPARLVVDLDRVEIQRKFADVASQLAGSARDAKFEIDDHDRVTITPSQSGDRVEPEKVVAAIFDASTKPDRRAELPIERGVEPELTTLDAQKLGVVGLVAGFTTHHPCCQPRVVNIHRIADLMDGVIVKPGDTFSVNKFVGPRTIDRGFVVAPSIGDGEMVDTVGGGISQFATTLFNALFDGGYQINERKAHSFYFSRYPMGIEATLSDPSPDLVFTNDTNAGLLIRTHYDKTSITVKIYGDNGGRKVERHVSGVVDITHPKVEYEADDNLSSDRIKVINKGTEGWSVWASRIITFANGERREEKRKVTYNPRPRVERVHSCNIPKGEPGHTGLPCPKKKDDDTDTETTGSSDSPSTPPANGGAKAQ